VEVTEVRIKKTVREYDPNAKENLLAWASITFDSSFVIHNVRIVESPKGMSVLMPSRRMKDGEIKDIAHPLNIATRRKIEQATIAEYKKHVAAGAPSRPPSRTEEPVPPAV